MEIWGRRPLALSSVAKWGWTVLGSGFEEHQHNLQSIKTRFKANILTKTCLKMRCFFMEKKLKKSPQRWNFSLGKLKNDFSSPNYTNNAFIKCLIFIRSTALNTKF